MFKYRLEGLEPRECESKVLCTVLGDLEPMVCVSNVLSTLGRISYLRTCNLSFLYCMESISKLGNVLIKSSVFIVRIWNLLECVSKVL